jgi:kumamolisin
MTMENNPEHPAAKASAAANPAIHSYVHYPSAPIAKRANCRPYFKLVRRTGPAAHEAPWNVPDLCAAYNWPAPNDVPGGGVIAIVELGGGWVQSDMDQFFGSINQPSPSITDVSVDGTKNTPDPSPSSPDGEVALDIQVAGAAYYSATGHAATIRVYWAQDIASAVRAATADGCDVCSISWGADEAQWPAGTGPGSGLDMEQAAADATSAGMIVFAASGDNDSSDGGPNPANVDLPASAPHVIGCGGTCKTRDKETVWNNDPGNPSGEGTGGGYSTLFTPMPDWQVGAGPGPGRMVPDVCADADPNTGYNIVLHGVPTVIGGTSAVAPLYAGLFASFGTKLHFITPELYLNQVCFNDITEGDNGAFRAGPGPDPCTGIGSPIGTRLAKLFTNPATTNARRLRHLETENARLRRIVASQAAKIAAVD